MEDDAKDDAKDTTRHSRLWGASGERWDRGGRLPDFSYAGYGRGERPLPEGRPEVDVRNYGAEGDGTTDDTEAFRKALEAGEGRGVRVPPGRYRITGILAIRHSGTRLLGAGPGRSVLVFPTPLNEVKPNWGETTSGRRTSNYSWSGGFLRIDGSWEDRELARVTEPARRGERALSVSAPEAFTAGDPVRLVLRDDEENSLARHLYAGDPGDVDNLRGRSREVLLARVASVDRDAGRIVLDRTLRTDVRTGWRPRLYPGRSSVEDAGIEGLGFEFPVTPYGGHFTEKGFNAIALGAVRNCWVRRVTIRNADSGIFVRGVNITLQDIRLESEREPDDSRRSTGHHGITLGGQDNLLTRFDFRTRFIHDITVTRGSAGNVASNGRGVDLALDHHRYGPHANLFTHLDLGAGTRVFRSGGGAALGRHSGARETFWCLRADRPQRWPGGWGPDLMNIVGLTTDRDSVLDREGRWFEAIPPERLEPCDLHAVQLTRRLERR